MSHGENWDDSVPQHLKYRRHFTISPNNGKIPIPSPTCYACEYQRRRQLQIKMYVAVHVNYTSLQSIKPQKSSGITSL